MATFTTVTASQLAPFVRAYGLDLEQLGGIPEGSVNSNYWLTARGPRAPDSAPLALGEAVGRAPLKLFLRVFEEQGVQGAQSEADLLAALEAGGVPTPAPLRRPDGQAIGELAGKPAALFPWREGTMRCQKSVSAPDVRAVGAALAQVHMAGKEQSRGLGRFRKADLDQRLDAVATSNIDRLRDIAAPLRMSLTEVSSKRRSFLPAGVIHGDLFRDNVLFAHEAEGKIVALLDFESAFDGPFAFDVAVTILSWTYDQDFDLALARAVVDGYQSVRPFTSNERAALYDELRFGALRFTITRITDFAMRDAVGPRVVKDYRRFKARFDRLTELGPQRIDETLFDANPRPPTP